jgi:hypothetical protein
MKDERWVKVEQLYHSALDREPVEREAYVRQACEGDEELRREVESLFEHGGKTGFLKSSAVQMAALEMAGQSVLWADTKLGNYRIIAKIGAGGRERSIV